MARIPSPVSISAITCFYLWQTIRSCRELFIPLSSHFFGGWGANNLPWCLCNRGRTISRVTLPIVDFFHAIRNVLRRISISRSSSRDFNDRFVRPIRPIRFPKTRWYFRRNRDANVFRAAGKQARETTILFTLLSFQLVSLATRFPRLFKRTLQSERLLAIR